jgi:hypothetical protein
VEGEYSPVLYRAAVVHTQAGAPAGCLAVAGGRVAATGTLRELRDRYPGAAVTDLGEAVVVPGFNDAHQHLTQMAGDLLGTDLGPGAVRGRGEIMAALRRGLAAAPDGGWVRATRYDPEKSSGGELLTRDDLDEVSASQPIVVCHVAGHWGVVNSAALRMAGLRDDSPDPPGGKLGRDGTGRLNGVVYERAFFPFSYPSLAGDGALIPALSLEGRLRGLGADPLAVPADDIAAIPVLATYVAGQRAWPVSGAAGTARTEDPGGDGPGGAAASPAPRRPGSSG